MVDEKIKTGFAALADLAALVKTLRAEGGCPWDRKQTAASMARYLLEESYELAEAIAESDRAHICEELGDVLFHIVFIAALFEEKNDFDLNTVARGIHRKMVRRHPHVFGDAVVEDSRAVKAQWERIKQAEKAADSDGSENSLLDSVPGALPALARSYKLSKRAAAAGFDWENLAGVVEKLEEEWAEFKAELPLDGRPGNPERAKTELGDLLFTMSNVARFMGIHPDTALDAANAKFAKRFRRMEKICRAQGKPVETLDPKGFDDCWNQAKKC